MRTWTKIGIGVAAVLLAVVVGTGAYAMYGGDDGDSQETSRELDEDTNGNPQTASEDDADGEGGGALGICIEGTVDCVDTPLNGEDGGNAAGGTCLEGTTNCVDTPMDAPQRCLPELGCSAADCPPDYADCGVDTFDPGFTCEPGLTVVQCLPDGVPADYTCVTMESDPIVVKCSPIDCVTTLPAPAEPVNPPADLEYDESISCTPPVDKCTDPAANVRCLPPECSVSSDGGVACPGSQPGVACPDDSALTPGECARISEGSTGAGTDAGEPQIDPQQPAVED